MQVVAPHFTQCIFYDTTNFKSPCAYNETRISQGFQGFGFGDGGFQMSFGIGAFPFGIFATAFNINDGRPPPAAPGTPQHMDEQFLSRLFLFVALVIMFWLLIA